MQKVDRLHGDNELETEQLHEYDLILSKIRRITPLFAVLGLEIDSERERKVANIEI